MVQLGQAEKRSRAGLRRLLRNLLVAGLTTRLEYDAQHYEGSSTIWGRETQTWLEEKVGLLVDEVEQRVAGKKADLPDGRGDFQQR